MNKWLNSSVAAHLEHFGLVHEPVVFEVGSRDGHDGVELATRIMMGSKARLWDRALVVLFECNPPQAEYIRNRYPNAVLHEVAISDKQGYAKFVQFEGNINEVGSSSLKLDWQPTIKKRNHIKVRTDTLDNYIPEDLTVHIMKIDVEGHTWEVLQGLGDRLRNVNVYHLETETETTTKKITEFMEANGFELYTTEHEWGAWLSDQVWVKK